MGGFPWCASEPRAAAGRLPQTSGPLWVCRGEALSLAVQSMQGHPDLPAGQQGGARQRAVVVSQCLRLRAGAARVGAAGALQADHHQPLAPRAVRHERCARVPCSALSVPPDDWVTPALPANLQSCPYAPLSCCMSAVPSCRSVCCAAAEANHNFSSQGVDWGFTTFMHLKDLMDPRRGFLRDDKLEVWAAASLLCCGQCSLCSTCLHALSAAELVCNPT